MTIRLDAIERGHDPVQAAALDAMRERFGTEPMGVQKTLRYRPEIFGFPFSEALQLALRGPSDWSPGERELFAGFTSLLNSCHFWTNAHGAVASYALGEEIWNAVATDWRAAPISPQLGATLVFLEKMTVAPGELVPADADAVLAAGVSREALVDAIHVCALFNTIVRLADALGWAVPPPEAFAARGRVLLESGYKLRTADEIRAL